MKKRSPESLSILLLMALFLLATPREMHACGPFSLQAIFTFSVHPDVPLDRFARGEIGVLQPTYARSYLVAAYRHLNATGLNAEEQRALVDFWQARLDYSWEDPAVKAVETWTSARARVPLGSKAPEINVYRKREKPNEYEQYLNCTQDAFENAAAALEERIKRYGADNPLLKNWVEAQDAVFANCSEGQTLPARLEAEADALLRADRNYQIAAALFYSAQFDEARRAFAEIARDESSPWGRKAQYLVARALVRQASLGPDTQKAEALTQAEAQLKQILNDQRLAEIHAPSTRLLNLVRLRLHPDERLRELAREVLRKDSQATIRQTLWDYTYLLDKFEGEGDEGTEKKSEALSPVASEDELTDWVHTFQATDTAALEHALQKWGQTSANAWLLTALSKINSAHPKAAALVAAGAKVKTDSPAYAGIIFHSVRLMLEAGREDEARARLDELLARREVSFPPSTVNLLLGLRMRMARNMSEFLKYAQRTPAALSWGEDEREIAADIKELDSSKQVYADGRTMFDQDSVRIFNAAMPLALLREAAASTALPQHLRRDVAVAAWVRSVLSDERETGRALTPLLESLVPELKGFLDDETSAQTPDARKFSALYAILKFPGMQPFVDAGLGRQTPLQEMDNYRDNWWCSFESETRTTGASVGMGEAAATPAADDASKSKGEMPVPPFPSFLDQAQRAAALRERAKLSALGTAPNYLCRLAIEWANKSPDDPRVPEALHLAVKSTRYGCADEQTGALSKAAFQLLHRKYPESPWAKKTPYWFKNS